MEAACACHISPHLPTSTHIYPHLPTSRTCQSGTGRHAPPPVPAPQRLLTSPEEKLDSMSLLFHMSGPSVVFLSLFSAATEYEALYEARLYQPEAVHLWGLIVLSGCVSFFLNLANFLVTKYTSAIALQVRRRKARSLGGAWPTHKPTHRLGAQVTGTPAPGRCQPGVRRLGSPRLVSLSLPTTTLPGHGRRCSATSRSCSPY